MDMAEHRLDSRRGMVQRSHGTVVLVASGYPGKVENGKRIKAWTRQPSEGVRIYHAGTRERTGRSIPPEDEY